MEKRRLQVASFILYALCAVMLLVFLYVDFFGFSPSKYTKFAAVAVTFLSAYFASFIRCRRAERDKACNIMYNTFFFLFTVYIVIIFDFTLVDGAFGRNISPVFAKTPEERRLFFQNGVNFIPFATVKLFINGYKNGVLSFSDIAENIFGNLLVLAPLAFFIPVYLRKINRFYKYLLLVTVAVVMIEALQTLLMTGAADIDDVIMNVSGAAAFYGLLRIKPVSRAVNAATFGVWEDEE